MVVEPALGAAGNDIENSVADRDAGPRCLLGSLPSEYSDRNILDGKITDAVIRRLDPTAKGGIESWIGRRHGTSGCHPLGQ